MKKEVGFIWSCPYCDHENKEAPPFGIRPPIFYEKMYKCKECNGKSKIGFSFLINGWLPE